MLAIQDGRHQPAQVRHRSRRGRLDARVLVHLREPAASRRRRREGDREFGGELQRPEVVGRVHEEGRTLHGILPQVEVRRRAERVVDVVQGQVSSVSHASERLQREQVFLVQSEVLQLSDAARKEQVRAAGRAAPPGSRIPGRDRKEGCVGTDDVPVRDALRAAGGCFGVRSGMCMSFSPDYAFSNRYGKSNRADYSTVTFCGLWVAVMVLYGVNAIHIPYHNHYFNSNTNIT